METTQKILHKVRNLVERGERITEKDCLELLAMRSFAALGAIATIPRERRFGKRAFYRIDASGDLRADESISFLYGPHTSPQEIVANLNSIRERQDRMGELKQVTPIALHEMRGEASYLSVPTAALTLRVTAISRLFLDNISHIGSPPNSVGAEVSYVAMAYGADTVDFSILPEVSQTAGLHDLPVLGSAPRTELTAEEIESRLIEARWKPEQIVRSILELTAREV